MEFCQGGQHEYHGKLAYLKVALKIQELVSILRYVVPTRKLAAKSASFPWYSCRQPWQPSILQAPGPT